MPKDDDDYVIFTVYGDGSVVYGPLNRPHVRYKHRAIPFPEDHGRLGDLDALMNNIGDVPYKGSVRRVLMSAPTIVPAEGENTDDN